MFTGVPQKSKAVAKAYFDEHLSHNDYYTIGEVEVGRWIGLGSEQLGLLEGLPVDREAFMALCDNLDPQTGERLTQRMNEEGNRRIFYDFTCSAPKSVSLLAVTMDDERILRAHQESARFAAKELERFAATRIRRGGVEEDRSTGNVIGAEFLHNSSRALDPQLHTHFTFFNATFDQQEQRWKALQTSDMFAVSQYATEVYRNELTRALNGLGYETEKSEHGFEIKGVDPELLQRYSKRSQERDKEIAKMEARLGRSLNNDEVSVAVHQTRSRKLKGITTEEVRERQLDQMSSAERFVLEALKDQASGFGNVTRHPSEPALDLACQHVFERSSVVSREELLRQALISGRGHLNLAELKESVAQSPELIQVGRDISTREILSTELFLIETLNQGKDAFPSLAASHSIEGSRLGKDQQEALLHVLSSPDQFTGFRGLAGTGKTSTLKELDRALQQSGHNVVYCAPTAAATDVLRKDGFSQALTLAKLLHGKDSLQSGSVVVLDEAGLVGTGDMKQLFERVKAQHCRVILSGDTGQHASVAQGDALRLLEEHSRYSFKELSTIRRQQAEDYRHVVEKAANEQPQQAFDSLDRLGWVYELDSGSSNDLYKAAAAAYLESRSHGKPALLIAPTWSEIESVTEAVREQLKERGMLAAQQEKVGTFDSLSWTEAEKRDVGKWERGKNSPGLQLLFSQDSGKFRQHELVDVVSVDATKNALQVRREDGSLHLFRPRGGEGKKAFDVGISREIEVCVGDLILLQANRIKEGIINGQVGTVAAVKDGQITLTDGRVLPSDYRQFSHGYCVTSHSAQARTVDAVFLVASSRSAAAIHQEQFYVSISRGRQECQVFTDDKELFRSRIARSTERQAALELVADALKKEGFSPPKVEVCSKGLDKHSTVSLNQIPQAKIYEQIFRLIQEKEERGLEREREKVRPTPQPAFIPPHEPEKEKEISRSQGMSL